MEIGSRVTGTQNLCCPITQLEYPTVVVSMSNSTVAHEYIHPTLISMLVSVFIIIIYRRMWFFFSTFIKPSGLDVMLN